MRRRVSVGRRFERDERVRVRERVRQRDIVVVQVVDDQRDDLGREIAELARVRRRKVSEMVVAVLQREQVDLGQVVIVARRRHRAAPSGLHSPGAEAGVVRRSEGGLGEGERGEREQAEATVSVRGARKPLTLPVMTPPFPSLVGEGGRGERRVSKRQAVCTAVLLSFPGKLRGRPRRHATSEVGALHAASLQLVRSQVLVVQEMRSKHPKL